MHRLGYRPALDGLRGVAVAAVVIGHAYTPALRGGGVGVDVFFVLSGYLITALLLDERERAGRIDIRSFYARRALRLLPALAAAQLLAIVLAALLRPGALTATAGEAAASTVYMANWWGLSHAPGLLAHTWSLSVEEQFYLVWPLALCALMMIGRRTATLAVVAGIILSTLDRLVVPGNASYFRTDTHAAGLLVGCLVALLASSGALRRLTPRVTGHYAAVGTAVLVAMAALVETPAALPFWGYAMTGLAAGALVVSLIVRLPATTRILGAGPLVWLGRRSYGVYLYHYPIVFALHLPGLAGAAAEIALSLVVAVVSYRYLERPFLRLKDRVARPAELRVPAAA